MRQIEDDLRSALGAAGFDDVDVVMEHEPPWSSDGSHRGPGEADRLRDRTARRRDRLPEVPIGSPRLVSKFGSTACKALMACRSCGEPFDHFKVF